MRRALIKIVSERPDGRFGVLIDRDANLPFALTAERPYLDNQPSISAIPGGTYTCRRVQSPKFGDTFEVTDVPGRSKILFHTGNIDDDSHGCILIGESFSVWSDGSLSIAQSALGFHEFLNRYRDVDEFELEIIGS